jgi:signal transduction histidine kinase
VAAHDLKNPIFGIRALSEVALNRVDGNDYVERKLSLIQSVADETLGLITDLLASAASTAQTQLDVERVDVVDIAEWVVHSFQPQAERKDQQLHCSLPQAPCPIRADKRKLREAMSNLVSNAIKYSPQGSQVTVEVERRNRSVCFRVEDEGPGLSEEDQKRMFAPFQRLTPSPTGDEGSSGLGLYIVKNIIDLHDGEVVVESTVGEGSTFEIVLPDASSSSRNGPSGTEAVRYGSDSQDSGRDNRSGASSSNGDASSLGEASSSGGAASSAGSDNGTGGAPPDAPSSSDQRDECPSPDRADSGRSQTREHNEVL